MNSVRMGKFPRHLLSVLIIAIFLITVNADDAEANVAPTNKKLEVKVYYEALCPDSIRFITNHLLPSMTQNNRFDFTDLKFVPFGNVMSYVDPKTNKKVMKCQHGQNECELNALHSCVIENNSERESFDIITCLMKGYNQQIDKCAEEHHINVDAAKRCKQSRATEDILEKYGKDTYALNPSFVPTISIDGVYDYYEQPDILDRFDAVFCNKYESKYNVKLDKCQ